MWSLPEQASLAARTPELRQTDEGGTDVGTSSSPSRVLMLSHRRFQKMVWRCGQFECEDVASQVDDVQLICPTARSRGTGRITDLLQRGLRKLGAVELQFLPRPVPTRLAGNHELFVVIVQHPADLVWVNQALPDWRRHCAKAVCWIEELWSRDLVYDKMLEPLRQFDLICLQSYHTVDALHEKLGLPCRWLPPAVDVLRFCPWQEDGAGLSAAPHRSIDFFAMGRRSDATHAALMKLVEQRGWSYLRDTVTPRHVYDHVEHRRQLAEQIARARFFLANKAKVDVPEQRGEQEELGFRFFEGAAGGAVMVGDPPRSESFRACFDWPDAVLPLPYGSTEVAERLDEFSADESRLHRIRRDNVLHSLRRHDWAHRWLMLLELAGLKPLPALRQRLERLAALAGRIEAIPPPGLSMHPRAAAFTPAPALEHGVDIRPPVARAVGF